MANKKTNPFYLTPEQTIQAQNAITSAIGSNYTPMSSIPTPQNFGFKMAETDIKKLYDEQMTRFKANQTSGLRTPNEIPTLKTSYLDDIANVRNQIADTTAKRTEGENKALNDYYNGLNMLQAEIDRRESEKRAQEQRKIAQRKAQVKAEEVKKENPLIAEAKRKGAEALKKAKNGELPTRETPIPENIQRELDKAEEMRKKSVTKIVENKPETIKNEGKTTNVLVNQLLNTTSKPQATPVTDFINPNAEVMPKEEALAKKAQIQKDREKIQANEAIRLAEIKNGGATPDNKKLQEQLPKWLSPEYKLSDEEKNIANDLINKFEQTDVNENATTTIFDGTNPDGILVPSYMVDDNGNYDPSKEVTPEHRQLRDNLMALKDKINVSGAVEHGIMDAVPIANNFYGNDWDKATQNAMEQNPLAYYGSLLGTGIALNGGAQALAQGTKYADLISKLGRKGGFGNAVLSDALVDAPIDALDTIGQVSSDIYKGKNAEEIAKNAALNVGINTALNVIPSVLGNLDEIGARKPIDYDFGNSDNALVGSSVKTNEITPQTVKPDVKSEVVSPKVLERPITENAPTITATPYSDIANEIVEDTPIITNKAVKRADNASQGNTENSLVEKIFGVSETVNENTPNNGGKVSKVRTNTLENSGINTKEELQSKYLDPQNFTYIDETEPEQIKRAIEEVSKDPQGEYDRLMSKTYDEASEDDVNKLMLYYDELCKVARESGNDEAWEQATKTFKQIQEFSTDRAKGLQALAKFSRNTKEGIIAQGLRDVRSEMEKTVGKSVAKDVMDKIVDSELRNIDDLIQQAMEVGINTREGKILYAKVGKIFDKYTPKTVRGKVTTILMDNMLGNFRTLVSRNAGGNLGYNALETLRQPITALYDTVLSKKTGKRTRTSWSKDKFIAQIKGFGKGVYEEADDLRLGLHTAKDGENTLANAIGLNSHSFSTNHKTNGGTLYNKLGLNNNNALNTALDTSNKVVNKLDDMVKHGLSVGDRPFYEAAYNQRLVELKDLRQRGLLGADVAKLSDAEFDTMAEISARIDGLSSTYQDDSAMSKALTDLKKSAGHLSEGMFGVDVLSQLSSPFVKTPGNIMDKAIDYSPLGFIKRYGETINDKIHGREFNQQRFVDEAGRNILGTGVVGAGYGLAQSGILNGAYDEDKDVKNMQKQGNMIEYGLNTGKGNLDISWIPVMGTGLVAGASIYDNLRRNPQDSLADSIYKGAGTLVDNLIDQSSTQGIQRLLGATNSYSSGGFGENIANTFESGLSQLEPSLVRQLANATDEYQRNISDGDRSYAQNNLLYGLPIVRENTLMPKVDSEGNVMLQSQGRGLGSRLLENLISPAQYKEYDYSALDNEALRIYNSEEAKGEKKQFITNADRKDITTEEHIPTDEEFFNYSVDVGKAKSEIGNALINSEEYQKLTDSEKASILSDVYSGIKAAVKTKYVDGYTTTDKIANAYLEGDAQGALDYLTDKLGTINTKAEMDSQGLPTNDFAIELYKDENTDPKVIENLKKAETAVKEVYGEDASVTKTDFERYENPDQFKKYLENKKTLEDAGMSANKSNIEALNEGSTVERIKETENLITQLNDLGVESEKADKLYERAKSAISDITPERFAKQYVEIDSLGDRNNSIKQDEMFAYFNKYKTTEAQAQKLWSAYGSWKTIPYLKENGTWGTKKH